MIFPCQQAAFQNAKRVMKTVIFTKTSSNIIYHEKYSVIEDDRKQSIGT